MCFAEDPFSRWYIQNSEKLDYLLGDNRPSIVTTHWQLTPPQVSIYYSVHKPSFEHLPRRSRQCLYEIVIRLKRIENINKEIHGNPMPVVLKKASIQTSFSIRLANGNPTIVTVESLVGEGEKANIGDSKIPDFLYLPADIPIFEVLSVENELVTIGPPKIY